jgi:DNA mismatch repair protein MutL
VADLFYNLPARRKFLKADGAESAQISKVVTQLALCYPEVGFALVNAGRKVLSWPPVRSVGERLYQIYGDRHDLVPVHRELSGVRMSGFIAALADQGPTRGPQHVFVNRRIVKDRTIAHAIIDAYSVASNKERSPEVHLFLEIPPDRIDVNVHPTKAEVRFKEQSLIHEIVRRGIGDALGHAPMPELQLRPSDLVGGRPQAQAIPGVLAGGVYTSRWAPIPQGGQSHIAQSGAPQTAQIHSGQGTSSYVPANYAPPAGSVSATMRPLVPLGQFRDTFIVAIDDDGICIVDQHVAHERVLFERIMQRLTEQPLESQRLLVPMLLDLPPGERHALTSKAESLAQFGFELEEFGGDSVKVTAMPALMPRDECEQALRALADDLEGLDRGLSVEDGLKRIAATMACHAAVKANYPLTMEKMLHILEELRATEYSTVCPHGRPVMLRLSRREVEKNFDRI